ncbi:MAG: molybdenum ABC transporter ATP-binding protein [Pseudomonadota bacterium]
MRLSLDLSTQYGGFTLAAAGTFDLAGVTALFGPSGAGKSTILHAIAGFRPGLGQVEVNGERWQDATTMRPAHCRPVGTVFQTGRLFDHLTIMGNLRFAAKRADRDGPQITPDMAIEALGIADLTQRDPTTLSGGERQRVAIARALLTRPRLLLMDEPLGALDRRAKAALLPLIASLPERFQIPVIFVSHQLEEITQIASRMIALRDGRFVGDGPLSQMIETLDPMVSGRFEAGALLTGKATRHEATYAMQAIDLGGAEIWMPARSPLSPGQDVRVRLRARDVSVALSKVKGISIRNQVPVTITSIAPEDGAFAEITLDLAGQTLRARSTRLSVSELGLEPGMQVVALVKSVALDRRLS